LTDRLTYRTPCGVQIERTSELLESHELDVQVEHGQGWGTPALRALAESLDQQRGLLLTSTFEYPGRYRRRALGFVAPPLVLESRGHSFRLVALNPRGAILLSALAPTLSRHPHFALEKQDDHALTGTVYRGDLALSEEERTTQPSVLSVVRALKEALGDTRDSLLGLYGAFGYDLLFQLETMRATQQRTDDGTRELVLYLPDELLVRDEASGQTVRHRYEFAIDGRSTHGLARTGQRAAYEGDPTRRPTGDHAEGEFESNVEQAKAAFRRGDLFEVTLSQTYCRPYLGAPSALFATLTEQNPAPYGFLANLGGGELLVGASPEMYVRVSGRTVETCPIAGTIARGTDALGDAAQIRTLLTSDKDEAELTMCTDVDRNDKARICEPGSVQVIGRRQVELYSRLIHTVDHVRGTLREGYDAIDALLTHMWAVTVTGAPKLDAVQFIEDHERTPRAYYGAAVGGLHFDGSLDTGLTLRTVHLCDGAAYVRAGATLLYDSDPAAERRECELKASAVLLALEHESARRAPVRTHGVTSSCRATAEPLRVLLIDHRDSFVHTLADYFRQANCQVTTLRHGFDESVYDRLDPQLAVLSPGPKRPDDFGLRETLTALARRGVPVFGVCLGLQAMVEYAGGELVLLSVPVHGKPSELKIVRDHPLFLGLEERFLVGRYHSLSARSDRLPACLEVLAISRDDNCTMAIAHRTLPFCAVQFHPESILSASGQRGLALIQNVVDWATTTSHAAPHARRRPHETDSPARARTTPASPVPTAPSRSSRV
jgi:anthranilate synthase